MVKCSLDRSSRLEVFYKRGVLRSFAKFAGKHLCQSLFLHKVVGLRTVILLKKRLLQRCFPVNFAKFLITPFLTEHLRWLFPSRGRQHKSLYKLSLKRSFNTLKRHIDRYLKNGVSKIIVHVIKHANFQLYTLWRSFLENLTIDDKFKKTTSSTFYISNDVSKTCWEEKMIRTS